MTAVTLLFGALFLISENLQLTGFAVKAEKFLDLKVNPICYSGAGGFRTWRIHNVNAYEVAYDWDIEDSEQNGSDIAPRLFSYINTTIVSRADRLRVFVDGNISGSDLNNSELCESLETLNETNQTLPEENQTIENQIEINQTGINITLPEENQTETNITEINETETNQTIINETLNETTLVAESSISSSSSGGGGGGEGGGGGSSSQLLLETVEETKETTATEEAPATTDVAGGQNPPAEEIPEQGKSFVALVGNAVKAPFDKINSFFENRGISHVAGYVILLVLAFLIVAVSRHNYFKARKKKNKITAGIQKQEDDLQKP